MKKITTRINETVLELIIGIMAWGLLWEIAILVFFPEKVGTGIGLWIGTALAVFSAFHMHRTLDKALDLQEKDAQKTMITNNMLRYFLDVAVLITLAVTGAANPLTGFAGIMGLKVAAYLQPFTHKILQKF